MNRTRPKSGIAVALLLAGVASGCDNLLDVNDNPNTPEFVRMEQQFPALIAEFTEVLSDDPAYWSSLWLQQWSYNRDEFGYSQLHKYELTSIDTNNFWDDPYTDVMNEAKNIMAESSVNDDWAYHGVAKFLMAWTATILSDAYGPIPFSDALDPLNPDPVYDTQQEVYQQAQAMIEEAIVEMQRPSGRTPGANDLLFEGDMARWAQLAHTVQARLHLRLSGAPGEDAGQRAQLALTSLSKGITENVAFDFLGEEANAEQPLYDYYDEDWEQARVASKTFVDLLRSLEDPRLPVMITPAPFDGEYRGHAPGEERNVSGDPVFDDADAGVYNDSIFSHIGDAVTADNLGYLWFSLAEARFIEAEARLITAGAAAADAPYRSGIRAHMQWLGMENAVIQQYLNDLTPLAQTANPLEAIITQKYIANFLQVEAWNDWRRTGYPVLQLVTEPYVDGIPQRLRTPADELSFNRANVEATGIPSGLDGLLHKVWWASGS